MHLSASVLDRDSTLGLLLLTAVFQYDATQISFDFLKSREVHVFDPIWNQFWIVVAVMVRLVNEGSYLVMLDVDHLVYFYAKAFQRNQARANPRKHVLKIVSA